MKFVFNPHLAVPCLQRLSGINITVSNLFPRFIKLNFTSFQVSKISIVFLPINILLSKMSIVFFQNVHCFFPSFQNVTMKNVVSQFVSNISPVSAPFQHLVTPWLLQTPSKRCTKSEQLLLSGAGIYKRKDPFEDPIDIYNIYKYINI